MKALVLLVCSFLSVADCIAQDSFRLEISENKGIVLDKGWKFQAGDSPEWAKTDYDDKLWESINPTLDIHDLPQIPRSGISWFRLHFLADSDILKNQLALIIQQSGASEIFLNGILFHRFGVLSADPEKVRAYDPLKMPVLFPVTKDVHQLLAIRYALQPNAFYTTIFETKNPAFSIVVKNLIPAIDKDKRHSLNRLSMLIFMIGVCVMMIILHLAFYLFYPGQKANLYFSLFAFFFMASIISRILFFYDAHTVLFKFYTGTISMDLILISYFFLLSAIYYLFEQKKDKLYWVLMALVIISFFITPLVYGWGWKLGGLLIQNLIVLNITRIAFLSLKRKKRGSWIIVAGAIFCLVFFIVFIMLVQFDSPTQSFDENSFVIRFVIYVLSVLSIPAATSIYLGLDFAFTNRSLKQKLIEVEELSSRTIAQEKEKKQILAFQNITLENQVQERTAELSQSLKELKETQSQLIQSEKMASLGELTAGIAHEIQNPLNFVNNFSEVNKELLVEMKDEIKKGNIDEVNALADDVIANEEKINHHGKRADAIVKGMLQHSRSSSGIKEPTDINKLADEYLRLAYHGLRAKDKSFNATMKTEFDETIGNISIIPQDMGRVILNLITNAFYAVNEKSKQNIAGYEPTVTITTISIQPPLGGRSVQIKVTDNGGGIPQKILDKIFQPFFTTKPTGQGTGLGLSLSYDIVKAHGGELKVETKEGEGSEFIILLPVV